MANYVHITKDTQNNTYRTEIDDRSEDCPFVYAEGEEPQKVKHVIKGICTYCGGLAYTVDPKGKKSCFPCAYSEAN